MPDIQTARLQRAFLGRDGPMANAVERALQANGERSVAAVDVLRTALLFAAIGSLLIAIAVTLL
jgi:hypothetical protein